MTEPIAQMGPMLILAGLAAGWMAEALSRAGGYGLITDMVISLVGSVVGGAAVWVLVFSDAGMLGMFLIGGAGGALAIVAQRGLWRSLPRRMRTGRRSPRPGRARPRVPLRGS
jgi:uncharacterized membrane protein YeaQ/YmgE (transglycosylase-associated protein family)